MPPGSHWKHNSSDLGHDSCLFLSPLIPPEDMQTGQFWHFKTVSIYFHCLCVMEHCIIYICKGVLSWNMPRNKIIETLSWHRLQLAFKTWAQITKWLLMLEALAICHCGILEASILHNLPHFPHNASLTGSSQTQHVFLGLAAGCFMCVYACVLSGGGVCHVFRSAVLLCYRACTCVHTHMPFLWRRAHLSAALQKALVLSTEFMK